MRIQNSLRFGQPEKTFIEFELEFLLESAIECLSYVRPGRSAMSQRYSERERSPVAIEKWKKDIAMSCC